MSPTRLKKIQGQSSTLEKILNRKHECAEVLQQLAAIHGMVNGMMLQVTQGHLTDHAVKEPEETQRETDLGTVIQVVKSYLKQYPGTGGEVATPAGILLIAPVAQYTWRLFSAHRINCSFGSALLYGHPWAY